MKILIVGYGKMGKVIEQIAVSRGNEVPFQINSTNKELLKTLTNKDVDVAIEFSQPEKAYENIRQCLQNNIPVVCGTTGWLDKRAEIEQLCKDKNGAFFYASNFSVGVNLFFQLNKTLARIMNNYPQYDVSIEEIHHTHKKDAPSGTAITLAEDIISNCSRKNHWVNEKAKAEGELEIISKRIDPCPGTHTITYNSNVDSIEIKHTAHNREGFAEGAVVAAEWLYGKQGVFGMNDLLKITN